jgi:hypothetical protein
MVKDNKGGARSTKGKNSYRNLAGIPEEKRAIRRLKPTRAENI